MKKLVLIVIVICLLSLPFQLFGKGQSDDNYSSDKIKLSMFHYLDLTDSTTAQNWDSLVIAFEKMNPGIELEIEFLYGEAYHNKLQAMAVSGQLPDLVYLYPGKRTSSVTDAGLAKDLSPWLAGHESEFADIAMKKQGAGGEMWELPEKVSVTSIMYTNNKLLKELGLTFPETLEELLAQKDVIRGTGLIPVSMANKDSWVMQSCFAGCLTERTGGLDWYNKAIAGNEASFTDPEFVDALKVIMTLYDNDMFSPGINQNDYMQGLDDFVNERAVYLIDGGWMVENMVGELTAEQKEYVSLESFPDIPGQKGLSGSVSATAGAGFGMNANLSAEESEAAWKWIWFYSGPEGSGIRQSFGDFAAYNLDVPEGSDPMVKKLSAFISKSPMGYVLDSVLDSEAVGELNNNLQVMMMGGKTPEQVAAGLEEMLKAKNPDRK